MDVSLLTIYEAVNILIPGTTALLYVIWFCDVGIAFSGACDGIAFGCVAYVVGLFISRCGSILIEPLFRKMKLLHFSDNYYEAEKRDSKLSILLREMNCYRTLLTEGLIIIVGSCLACVLDSSCWGHFSRAIPAIVAMSVIFCLSYIKQSKSIVRRIGKGSKYDA